VDRRDSEDYAAMHAAHPIVASNRIVVHLVEQGLCDTCQPRSTRWTPSFGWNLCERHIASGRRVAEELEVEAAKTDEELRVRVAFEMSNRTDWKLPEP
jgi:hypothetical protein